MRMNDWNKWNADSDVNYFNRSVVAFDLDDTLTVHGALPAAVVNELEKVQQRGWRTVLVTGRSAGWVDALTKLMPFDAIVGENGAIIFEWPSGKSAKKLGDEPKKYYWSSLGYGKQIQGLNADLAQRVKTEVLKTYPQVRVASDQAYRIYDLAIDFAEEVVPALDFEQAKVIQEIFESFGAVAKVSSIHVNGWWGNFSKQDGLRFLMEDNWNLSLEKNLIYVGDSPNDAPLFEVAGLSVGVANIKSFIGKLSFALPKYVTSGEAGWGSIELLKSLPCRT